MARLRRAVMGARLWACVLAFLGPTVVGPTALASPPSDAFRFVYDADGRLKAAIDPEGDTATYNWDATGNLLHPRNLCRF